MSQAVVDFLWRFDGPNPIARYWGSSTGFGTWNGTIENGGPKGPDAVKFSKIPARKLLKLAGTDVVVEMFDHYFLTRVDRPEEATDLEAEFCGVDGGGPALIEVDGQPYVAGIIRWTASPPQSPSAVLPYGKLMAFHRVSYAAQWIEDTTGVNFGTVRHERTVLLVAGAALLVGAGWTLTRSFLTRRARLLTK